MVLGTEFTDWKNEVLRCMYCLSDEAVRCKRSGGPLLDCAIPYGLGWTPVRAATAILRLNDDDHRNLVERLGLRV